MTAKHFKALADYIRQANNWNKPENQFNAEHLNILARFCKEQNPAFKKQQWLDYIAGTCGTKGGRK